VIGAGTALAECEFSRPCTSYPEGESALCAMKARGDSFT